MLKLNEAKFVCVILNIILFCQTDNVYLNENTCPLAFIFQIQKERIRNLCEYNKTHNDISLCCPIQ